MNRIHEWREVQLGEIAEVNWGDTSVTKASYVESGYTAYSASGPDGFLPYADHNRDGIVLSAIGARCGKTWYASGSWSCIKNTIALWSIDNQVSNEFLYWATCNPDFWPKRGAAQPFIGLREARAIKLLIPPMAEQKRIVDILSRAEGIVRLRREAQQKAAEIIPALFLDMFGDPATNPKGWPTASIKELGRVTTGKTPSTAKPEFFGGDVPFVTPGDLNVNTAVPVRHLTEAGAAAVKTVSEQATLVCCIGATIGKTDRTWVRSSFNQQINAIEWGEHIKAEYGLECMRQLSHLIKAMGGQTALPILKKSLFEQICVPIPPIEQQISFERTVTNIRSITTQQRAAMNIAQATFDALLAQSFASPTTQQAAA